MSSELSDSSPTRPQDNESSPLPSSGTSTPLSPDSSRGPPMSESTSYTEYTESPSMAGSPEKSGTAGEGGLVQPTTAQATSEPSAGGKDDADDGAEMAKETGDDAAAKGSQADGAEPEVSPIPREQSPVPREDTAEGDQAGSSPAKARNEPTGIRKDEPTSTSVVDKKPTSAPTRARPPRATRSANSESTAREGSYSARPRPRRVVDYESDPVFNPTYKVLSHIPTPPTAVVTSRPATGPQRGSTFTNVGPGAYDTAPSWKANNVPSLRRKMVEKKVITEPAMPGPGAYDAKYPTSGRMVSIKSTWKDHAYLQRNYPTPTTYTMPPTMRFKKEYGKCTFGSAFPEKKFSTVAPGPGSYYPGGGFEGSPRRGVLPSGAFIGHRLQDTSTKQAPPGPGTYDLRGYGALGRDGKGVKFGGRLPHPMFDSTESCFAVTKMASYRPKVTLRRQKRVPRC